MEILINLFPQSDKAWQNADRLFFGTDKKVVIINEQTRISMDDIYNAHSPISIPASQQQNSNDELNNLKRTFDLFGYMKQRNGDFRKINRGYMFKQCNICEHKDDLMYYEDTNTFYCFGANGRKGGSIIDYIMYSEKVDVKTAINKLYELSGKPRQHNVEFINDEWQQCYI